MLFLALSFLLLPPCQLLLFLFLNPILTLNDLLRKTIAERLQFLERSNACQAIAPLISFDKEDADPTAVSDKGDKA